MEIVERSFSLLGAEFEGTMMDSFFSGHGIEQHC
jgi:hypothetical protein